MKILNGLPVLKSCLERWEEPPTERQFLEEYAIPMAAYAGRFFNDWGAPFADAAEWRRYRQEALHLDPAFEEKRASHWLSEIEKLLGFKLEGEIILCGAFEAMDGFARFERGTHRVFLGVDESHRMGAYLDILEAHELTHVARESRPEIWPPWGLDVKMSRSKYLKSLPEIEHLFDEGIACAISEILVPGQDPWKYCYQTRDSFEFIIENGASVDREIRRELTRDNADWGRWYNGMRYEPVMPDLVHYVWAWAWARTLLRDFAGGDPRKIISVCSKEFVEHALQFELSKASIPSPQRTL